MKRLLTLVTALATALALAAPVGAAQPGSSENISGYAIVELSSPGAAMYQGGIKSLPPTAATNGRFDPSSQAYAAYRRHLNNEHANFRANLGRVAQEAAIVSEYFITANAVAVELNGAQPQDLKRLNGVKEVHHSTLVEMHMDQSVGLINAEPAWAQVGGRADAGSGVRVAVIDSGIVDSLIPDFHEFFACENVEFGGIFYSGETGAPAIGIKNEAGALPAPGVAFVNPHGNHVAGTVGGCITTIDDGSIWDGTTLSGVAPGATLVDYNVFPGIGAGWVAFGGSAFSHDIANAIELAVASGDHVINMSLGGRVNGPHDFLAEVSNAAVAAGVVVVTSAGNSGPGSFTIGSPASAADVISVGATTNTRGMGVFMTVPGFEDDIVAFPGEFADFDGNVDYTLIDWPGSDNLACTSDVADGSLNGEVVLIERGVCTFTEKVTNAEDAGAGGVVVYSDDRDPGGMAKSPGDDTTIPAVMIGRDDGLALESELETAGSLAPVTITEPIIVPETPNQLASFSSRGPTPFTGIIKPDVVAPGVNVLSSVFFGWELFNGTSMASPHVAGASAVLLDAHPDWTPAQVKSALATTATDLGLTPWQQGSGLVNLEAALDTNAFFAPTNASFGTFTGNKPANATIEISIDSTESCDVVGTTGDFVSAELTGDTLDVSFQGGRTAPGGSHAGYVTVECGSQTHTIPWGAQLDR